MELKELRTKTLSDLSKLLAQHREKFRGLRFSVSAKQLKNIREFREARKLVARILTVINEKRVQTGSEANNESNLNKE
ncbi:MAG: 50S ribosomal protein L29 [Parcubacteria group bacterium GW2011_GWA2_43_17]|nr:MAG: 50S ribosomal protein L29 [Parcubacteria group bacterium GW2011_GWA2_43_17]KKT92749.1 MAG: 50S ribosomal protein L29 [Parcubacteria group bacterium GW2011_GWF2_45_11]KKT97093.1 MAG: 50S ribosomal protein L29 [Parcubacteria group bacterium GW2011_GWC2_45_15]OGY93340.1 MAG: 50S ribosomal protein L29 [Candidatus Komeilibacteria bacterium RIFOXYC2_FULL_45_12]OGY94927.1 MAG: 50S ribosomal protein L29 [Candidatus Komeilibacteria bacterium RIFOXYA2_FULL_45_9]HAH03954.1 50S ribosomal protein L